MSTPPSPPRTFRGLTAEQRVAARRDALTGAALDLIGTTGWASATMTAICQRAGLTERYFYESFRNREALFVALLQQVVEQIEQAVVVAASATDLTRRERAEAIAEALLHVIFDDPRLGRVALLEGVENDEMRRVRRAALSRFESLLQTHREVLLGPGAAAAPELVAASLVGAAQELFTRRLDGELAATDDQLAAHLVSLAMVWTGADGA